MPRLISGKARVVAPEDVSADRYEFLDLSEAEPNLGEATADNYVLYYDSNEPGGRKWDIPTGFTGSQGTQGTVGFTGSQGTVGFTGSQGTQGTVGFTGSIGFTGSQGTVGFTGSQGTVGFTGSQGTVGFTGSQGTVGFTGSQGTLGFTGSQGTLGFTGSQGVIGFSGSQGDTGFVGSQGVVGFSGSQGTTGAGFTGSQGITGTGGGAGFTGSQGITGTGGGAGFTGSQGIAGTGSIGFTGSEGTLGSIIQADGSGQVMHAQDAGGGNWVPRRHSQITVNGSGEVTAVDFVATSDATLKDVAGNIMNPLSRISQIRGVKYHWNEESELDKTRPRVGVLAQEVFEVLPEAVHTLKTGKLGVNYGALVPLLIEAIKELNEKVEELSK